MHNRNKMLAYNLKSYENQILDNNRAIYTVGYVVKNKE